MNIMLSLAVPLTISFSGSQKVAPAEECVMQCRSEVENFDD